MMPKVVTCSQSVQVISILEDNITLNAAYSNEQGRESNYDK